MVRRQLLDLAGLKANEGHGGAVTLLQRFGSAVNLNVHHPEKQLPTDVFFKFKNSGVLGIRTEAEKMLMLSVLNLVECIAGTSGGP